MKKDTKIKIEINIHLPEGLIEEIKKILDDDHCKYCGGELEAWGSKDAICKECGKKQ